MNNKIIIATNNPNKVKEYANILKKFSIEAISQKEAGIELTVEETGTTFIENAILKAKLIYEVVKLPVIADDSGLMIDYLNGMPGVYSHRFLGENASAKEKCEKIVELMKNAKENERTAKFICAICYIDNQGKIVTFEGICKGNISKELKGENGFDYDRIFLYGNQTFAQMSGDEKDKVSHRRKAIDKLLKYFNA